MRRSVPMLLAGFAATLGAQEPGSIIPSVPAGTLVRIESRSIRNQVAIGTLADANSGFVTAALDGQGTLLVSWSRITTISVAAGADRSTAMAKGLLAGLSASLVTYPALSRDSRTTAAVVSFGVLPIIGAVVGRSLAPRQWDQILWRPAIDTVMETEATRLRLRPDTKLLLRSGRTQLKGRIVEITDDSIAVQRSARAERFGWTEVSELHVRHGRNRARGAALGFSALAVAAGLAIVIDPPAEVVRKQQLIIGNMLAGGLLGALIGAPGWSRIPVPVR